jgi:rhamnosyltransferase
LGAVVTYNPGEDLGANLAALRQQIARVIVIDNGSRNIDVIRETAKAAGCELIANPENLGVAAALNQAARIALEDRFDWLATFDHDSLIRPGAIEGLLAVQAGHPDPDRIAIVAMSHVDRATGRDYLRSWDVIEDAPGWRSVRTTITSGSLTRASVFHTVGLFDESLFVDSVDHEFCLRCRRHGLLIIEGRAQLMDHALGSGETRSLLGRPVVCGHHAPVRRYYIMRNQLEVCRRYMRVDPTWARLAMIDLMGNSLAVLIFEDQKAAKLRAMLKGALDFARRRFGPR